MWLSLWIKNIHINYGCLLLLTIFLIIYIIISMSQIKNLVDKKTLSRTPIWLMRQAGRYMPEYQEIKKKTKSFLEMCYSPEIACEITLQPIKRFDFDAAIIFSDILVIPNALGLKLDFLEKIGPVLERQEMSDVALKKLDLEGFESFLKPVYQAVSSVKDRLSSEKDLIGFSGGAWTLFSYMVEGTGSKNFESANLAILNNKKESERLIEILVEAISKHLVNQIEAGATSVQIFDSWAGEIMPDKYEDFIVKPTKKIVEYIKSKSKNTPIIGFPRGSNFKYEEYVEKTGVDVLGIDQELPLRWVKERLFDKAIIQGNMDPMILLSGKEDIYRHFNSIEGFFGSGKYIFNLGRGVHKTTPIENVHYLIDLIRKTQ